MDEDDLDEADVRQAILRGSISAELTDDPRGTRFVVRGAARNEEREGRSGLSFSAFRFVAYNHGVSIRGITFMAKDFCEYCNATLPDDEKLVTVYRHRRGRHFIFERVPARVCQKCGERYFSAQSVSEMEREMQQPESSSNLVPVPVIELQPAR